MNENKKYELVFSTWNEFRIANPLGWDQLMSKWRSLTTRNIYRIKLVRDELNLAHSELGVIKRNDIGGFVIGEFNLSQTDDSWIDSTSGVFGTISVSENSIIANESLVVGSGELHVTTIIRSLFDGGNNKCSITDAFIKDCRIEYVNDIRESSFLNSTISGGVYTSVSADNIEIILGNFAIDELNIVTSSLTQTNIGLLHGGRVTIKNSSLTNISIHTPASTGTIDGSRLIGGHIEGGFYIERPRDLMTITHVGSDDDIITAYRRSKTGPIIVVRGCFTGTTKEFLEAVDDTHKGNPYIKKDYYNIIKFIRARFRRESKTKAQLSINNKGVI